MNDAKPSRSAACSWSGGKDCCLALHRAASEGFQIEILLTMLTEDGKRSRSNGVALSVLEAQAGALGAHLIACATSWIDYERTFRQAVDQARSLGATAIVFGDIRGTAHRHWNEEMCRQRGVTPLLPLWDAAGAALLRELERDGYCARITSVNGEWLEPDYLGRRVDAALGDEMHARGLDPCGEAGEYHTVIENAPNFTRQIPLVFGGATMRRGYWHAEAGLAAAGSTVG